MEKLLKQYPQLQKMKSYGNLFSYYYYRNLDVDFNTLTRNIDNVLFDSGALTFQFGAKDAYKIDLDNYVQQYIDFISTIDCSKIKGFFEMDVGNIYPMEKVNLIRKKLEATSNKIIPVWHNYIPLKEFIEWTHSYNYIAFSGRVSDIRKNQFSLFCNVAKSNNCKIHGLGIGDIRILKKGMFDSVDTSNHTDVFRYGYCSIQKRKFDREFLNKNREQMVQLKYKLELQKQYNLLNI